MFIYSTQIKLHQTDAAGLLFFSHQFELIHDAYESLLEKIGYGFAVLIKKKSYFLPIVHASCDYKKPLFVGNPIKIKVTVENIGKSSFTFAYELWLRQTLVGTAQTVHVTMDKKTRRKIPLPALFRKAIEQIAKNS